MSWVRLVQARATPDDGTTMDERTLRAVLLKAREAGVAALWMDAWCFRFAGEYVHEDFCALLSHVVRAVRAVIWVPLSRANMAPSFQFRMWCTFEAAVVEHRQLPVFIAGELTASQRRLARLGPRTFALPCLEPRATLAELRILSTFNVCFLFMAIACPLALLPLFFMSRSAALAELVPALGRQFALARNGQRVLRTLLQASREADSRMEEGGSGARCSLCRPPPKPSPNLLTGARQHRR